MTTKAKLNLLELGAYLGNVSETWRTLGYSRVTFYRIKKKFDERVVNDNYCSRRATIRTPARLI